MSSRRRSPSPWMAALLLAAILVPTTLAASREHRSRDDHRSHSTRNVYNDHRAPKPVRNLEVTAAEIASVTLDWSRTWDNVGVEGYGVYLDGSRAAETPYSRYTLRNLACGVGYQVGVDAFDDARNRSRLTSTFVSTAACRDVTPPTAPADIRSVAATETTVILAWSPSSDEFGVAGYGIYVGGFWVGRWSEPTATITNLSCGQTYQIGIDATDAAGNRSARTDVFFSTASCADRTPPSSPGNLVVTNASQDTVTLGWTASTDGSGIAEYGLYRDGAKVGNTTTTTGQFDGLACGTTYTFGVDASDAANNRSSVASLSGATAPCGTTEPPPPDDPAPPPAGDTTPPTAPPNLHTHSVTESTVVVRWDSSTDAGGMAGYQIFRDGTKIGEGPGVHGGLTNQWTDRNASCGTEYEYAVAGVDTAGNVGPQAELDVSTTACETTTPPPPPDNPTPPPAGDTTPPTAPPNLHTHSVTESTVVVRWDSSTDAGGMAGYQIFRDGTKIGEGPGVHGGLTNQWTDRNASCGTEYEYAVAGVDTAGNVGPQAELDVSTTACETTTPPPPPPPNNPTPPPAGDTTPPTAPSGVATSTRTATSIALTWQPSTDDVGVVGYGLYRGGSRVGTSSTTTWIFTGLTCGTSYTLGVDSVDAAGNRSNQAVVMVSTTACADTQPPNAPTNLAASNVGQTSLTLGWSAASDNVGVTGYDVYRNGTRTATVTGLSSAQTGLTCGTSYTFAVRARDAAGNASPQAQLIVSTSACTQQQPPPPSSTQTLTSSQFNARATSGATIANVVVTGSVSVRSPNVTIQNAKIQGGIDFAPGSSGSKLLNSTANHVGLMSADNILLEGNVFDGQGRIKDGITMWDDPAGDAPSGWVFRNNTFRNFYIASDNNAHSQAIYVGYSTNGLIEGNTFENNGTTSHIFFTWWGETANPSTSYPRNICVRNNTFRDGPDVFHYYDVNFRAEIPSSAGIVIQRDATSTSPQFYGSC